MSRMTALVQVEGDHITVTGSTDLHGRHARRFFEAILGGERLDDGWRIAPRSSRVQDLVVRINSFLESQGFETSNSGDAARSIELALGAASQLGAGRS